MVKHAGSWATKFSPEDIIRNGKTLMKPFNELSNQDFEAHVRDTYDIDYRRALDWMNAARRFGDKLELIEGLSEAVIRRLSAPSLMMADTEQVISDIRAGKIKSDYRSVERSIRTRKTEKLIQEKLPSPVSTSPSSSQNIPLPSLDLETLRRETEARKVESEQKLKEILARKEHLKSEIAALEAEERQIHINIDKLSKHLQAYVLLLES